MSMQANPDNLTSGQGQNRLAKHQSKETKEQHFEKRFHFSLCGMQLLCVAGRGLVAAGIGMGYSNNRHVPAIIVTCR